MSRNAYSLDQLVSEVEAMYPKVKVSFGDPDGFDVVREVHLDLSKDAAAALYEVLQTANDDRFARLDLDGGLVTVVAHPQSPVADRRGEVGLVEAAEALAAASPDADGADGDAGADGKAEKPSRAGGGGSGS